VLGWSPSWSPDGARIAFLQPGRIVIANADGSDAQSVWKLPRGADASDLAWSPDGGELAFATTDAHQKSALSLLDLASRTVHDVLPRGKLSEWDSGGGPYGVDWQPLQAADQLVLPQFQSPGPCGLRDSQTLFKTPQVRVFMDADYRFYGCLYRRNQRVRLFRGRGVDDSAFSRVVAAGPYVGFALDRTAPSDVSQTIGDVAVYDLRSGHQKLWAAAADLGKRYSQVLSFVMTRTGAVAWIARGVRRSGFGCL
jgi:hypothetical protein